MNVAQKRITELVTKLITKLDNMNPEQIADHLRAAGIQGEQGPTHSNPVCRLLQNLTGHVWQIDLDLWAYKLCADDDRNPSFFLPETVQEFTDRFNDGEFPDLIIDGECPDLLDAVDSWEYANTTNA